MAGYTTKFLKKKKTDFDLGYMACVPLPNNVCAFILRSGVMVLQSWKIIFPVLFLLLLMNRSTKAFQILICCYWWQIGGQVLYWLFSLLPFRDYGPCDIEKCKDTNIKKFWFTVALKSFLFCYNLLLRCWFNF